ncbi:MAG: DUF3800 domain-containing protein [Victivallales bacterium]|nr:DUF3800 domain-containing protein [Victivallales bacterium]
MWRKWRGQWLANPLWRSCLFLHIKRCNNTALRRKRRKNVFLLDLFIITSYSNSRAGHYDPGPPNSGEFPRFFFFLKHLAMTARLLSVFIDESGDFGLYEPHCPYYIIAMVLHDQSVNIAEDIKRFDKHLRNTKFPPHAIHSGPLIRREQIYSTQSRSDRKYLFNALFNFARKLDFHYVSIVMKKTKEWDRIKLTSQLSKAIADNIRSNMAFWKSFDKIIVYYDNGQFELTKILTSVFAILFSDVVFRKVNPVDYKLFQIADMVCTLKLLEIKCANGMLSKSEHDFFESERTLKKIFLKAITKKQLP